MKGIGKKCFVTCSRKCFSRCVKGSYEVPDSVGRCDSAYCKMLKRTMLDMEGVFSTASESGTSPAGSEATVTQEQAQRLLQEAPASLMGGLPAQLNIQEISTAAELAPEDVEQIMSGSQPSSISTKSLADSVLFDLSDEDRDMLEKING